MALGILRKFHSPNLHPRMDFFHHTTWFNITEEEQTACGHVGLRGACMNMRVPQRTWETERVMPAFHGLE